MRYNPYLSQLVHAIHEIPGYWGQAAVRRRIESILKMNFLYSLILSFSLLLCSSLVFANEMYPLDTAKKEAQFSHLLKNLRCLVCQNQDLADSNAPLAKDLRLQVYQLVQEGKSDNEISDYLTSRYGDFILFKPPVKALTWLLWFGPFVFLLLGLFIFWNSCLRSKSDD